MGKINTPASFPRGALIGAGGLVALAFAIAVSGRINGPDLAVSQTPEIAHRDLRFADGANGQVDVFNAADGAQVNVIPAGQDNFLRATIRGLTQQRKREDLGPSTPFRLTRWADGRLTLTDPATDRKLELEAFGETNEASFAHLLTDGSPASGTSPARTTQ